MVIFFNKLSKRVKISFTLNTDMEVIYENSYVIGNEIMKRQPVCKKSKWMPDEDRLLQEGISRFGIGQWKKIAEIVPGRSAKQCRERWIGQLDPNLNHNEWTVEEDQTIISLQKIHGNSWARIAMRMSGRSANAVKNRFRFISKRNNLIQEMTNSSFDFLSSPEVTHLESPAPSESEHIEIPLQTSHQAYDDNLSLLFFCEDFECDEWMM